MYKYINCFEWSYIGYHYFITRDGSCHDCRPIKVKPAGVYGHNTDTIQICLAGYKSFGQVQFRTLARVIKNLMEAFQAITLNDIHGHNEFTDKKTCPEFDVKEFITRYLGGTNGNESN